MSCDRSYYLQEHTTGEIVLLNGESEVVYFNNNKLLYNVDPLTICYDTYSLVINTSVIEDPELLKFRIEFRCLFMGIKLNETRGVTFAMKLLEPFEVLVKKKLEYAFNVEDFKCGGCSAENCKSVKIFNSIINVHHDQSGFELLETVTHKIIDHICKPYPSKVKSARN